MSLREHMQGITGSEYPHANAGKRWQSPLLAAKLRDLRTRERLTQYELAEWSGISQSAVNNYERMLSTPKEAHRLALAKALDIRPEALKVYDMREMPAHVLFQLGDVYGFEPAKSENCAYLRATSDFMKEAWQMWDERYDALRHGDISRDDYERWKDQFASEFEPADFPRRYECVEGKWNPIEPWANVQFGLTLKRLRKQTGRTQGELAEALGVKVSAIRSYEQGYRLPRTSQLKTIASVLGVTEAALTFFDFGSPVQAMHALFQMANIEGMIPGRRGYPLEPVLNAANIDIERIIADWAEELEGRKQGRAEHSYQDWKDSYVSGRYRMTHTLLSECA